MNTEIEYSVPAARLYIITLDEEPPPMREPDRPGPDCPSLTIDHAAERPQLASYEELQAGMDSKFCAADTAAFDSALTDANATRTATQIKYICFILNPEAMNF
jgi:hypothetical protein